MRPAEQRWTLERFLEQLDLWVEREALHEDVKLLVLPWIQSRLDDPYRGVRREPDVANLWYGPVPGVRDAESRIAVGSYFVFESRSVVRCNSFALLSPPI